MNPPPTGHELKRFRDMFNAFRAAIEKDALTWVSPDLSQEELRERALADVNLRLALSVLDTRLINFIDEFNPQEKEE